MTPSVVLITGSSATEGKDKGLWLGGWRYPCSFAPPRDSHGVCQKDVLFSPHHTSPDGIHELPERSYNSQQLYAQRSSGNCLTQGATPAESQRIPPRQRARGSTSHTPVSTPTGEPSTRKTTRLRKHWMNWTFTTSAPTPSHSICSGYESWWKWPKWKSWRSSGASRELSISTH